ncbi:DNA-binding protein [Aliigemmobacter aestuarii]|uniref:DNA-binding protein n=1 Tax=Aliigemmobacter aestuarii TaxID=1445661 RepID=A0A4S3ML05_9RHOB|nr:helix-turn-helix domain-containing protein [Gemmobacter aestuarii]THD81394.1 DNA-binding protein [Gemmobacter aestuarii]
MAKRPNPRAIRSTRTYTIDEAAIAMNITTSTIRSWVKAGLPLMRSRRPYLILGDALQHFLQDRATQSRTPLKADQLYCLSCKAGRAPMGMMVDCIPQTPKTARLEGLCEACGGTCNRMISRARIADFAAIFDLALNEGRQA